MSIMEERQTGQFCQRIGNHKKKGQIKMLESKLGTQLIGLKEDQTLLKGKLVNWKMNHEKIIILKNTDTIGQKNWETENRRYRGYSKKV